MARATLMRLAVMLKPITHQKSAHQTDFPLSTRGNFLLLPSQLYAFVWMFRRLKRETLLFYA